MNDYDASTSLAVHPHEFRDATPQGRGAASRHWARGRNRRITDPLKRASAQSSPHHRSHGVRHFVEMVAAMVVGMAVLGMLTEAALSLGGLGDSEIRVELDALLMAFDMAVGMTVWMRYRGHAWAAILEMDAAMFVPFLALFPFLWLGMLSEDAMFGLGHLLMLPAMGAVMYRRRGAREHV